MNRFILFCLFVTIIFSTSYSQYTSAELDSFILAKMQQYHFPGLQACIVQDDSVIWKGAYGYANIDSKILVTDSTLFTIQSVSKTTTGTALMQLWEQGSFILDEDVNNYLTFSVRNPNHPKVPITFRMLLTHTSSISGWGTPETLGGDSPIELGYYLANYFVPGGIYYDSRNWNSWVPGTQWDYSDESIALAGYLVEILSDTSFEQYCQDSLFIPLAMNETSYFLANLNTNNIAIPYTYSNGNYNLYGHYGDPVYPAAQIRTSAIQFSHFISAFIQKGHYNGKSILNSSTVDSMTTIQFPSINPTQGLIWFIDQHNIPNVGTRRMCTHLGGWHGASALAGYIFGNGENIGAVILANNRDDNGIVDIGYQLVSYGIITDIGKDNNIMPNGFSLSQNYPNPFNPSTTIEFSIPKTEFVTLKIYNTLGQKVATLVNKKQPAGSYSVEWDASGFASGVYIYELKTSVGFKKMRKLLLLK